MAKISGTIELEQSTWDRLDAEASRSGLTRDQVVDAAVRRALGGRALEAIFERVRETSSLTPEEAAEVADSELAALRAEQDGHHSGLQRS